MFITNSNADVSRNRNIFNIYYHSEEYFLITAQKYGLICSDKIILLYKPL